MTQRETIIANYIQAYNNFDVSGMVSHFSERIVFENIQNGEVTMTLNGIEEFKVQAETAKSYFTKRAQNIKAIKHQDDQSEVEIEYRGVLAVDFPNGMKKGQEINLHGKSVFKFQNEQIVRLTDIS